MTGTHLEGLDGTNPLGLLAALGVQVAFLDKPRVPRLWWSEGIAPYAIVDREFTFDRIAECTLDAIAKWKVSSALNPRRVDGSCPPKGDELKLRPADVREYLTSTVGSHRTNSLATALVAEGSLDGQGVAKPSDLYFTAGQMKFLDMARRILGGVERCDLVASLQGPWTYESTLPSLGWDIADDRVYALRANNPSPEKKLTNPGAEALAVLGLSLYPVFRGRDRTLTQGFSGSWKSGYCSWPLWHYPAGPYAVRSLLAHAYDHPTAGNRHRYYGGWGVFAVLRSPVRRSDQGGYGTFGPPEVVWRG